MEGACWAGPELVSGHLLLGAEALDLTSITRQRRGGRKKIRRRGRGGGAEDEEEEEEEVKGKRRETHRY